jgi:hypothetical protein
MCLISQDYVRHRIKLYIRNITGTCNILAVICAPVNRAICPLSDHITDLQLHEVDLPLLIGPLRLGVSLAPGLGQLLLQLDVEAFEINLVRAQVCVLASQAPGPRQLLRHRHFTGA